MIITILFYKPKGFFYLLSLYYKISIYIVRRNLINQAQLKFKKEKEVIIMQEILEQDKRLRDLETSQAETRTYVKMIQADIEEIKTSIKELHSLNLSANNSQNEMGSAWQNIVIELIKLASLCIIILGTIVGAIKVMGT